MNDGIMGAGLIALLASLFTWLLAWLGYRWRLRAALDALRAELGSELEQRVRDGALAAGRELLPEFRAEVTAGFKDALLAIPRGDLTREAARSMARTGAEIFGASLDSLLGSGKKPRE